MADANPFAQFDEPPANPFAQFDAAPPAAAAPEPSFLENLFRTPERIFKPLLAAMQGTSPSIEGRPPPLGALTQSDSGPAYSDAAGAIVPIDTGKHVLLPGDNGNMIVYPRTAAHDESRASSLGRILGFGMTATPNAEFQVNGAAPAVTGKGIVAPFTEGGQKDAAGNILNEAANGQRIVPAEPPLPGMTPSLGQSTNNSGLLWLDRSIEQGSPAAKDAADAARTANNQAILRGVNQIGDVSQAEAAPGAMRDALAAVAPPGTAADRVMGDLAGTLGTDGSNVHNIAQALSAQRSADAAPLYEKAFAAGPIHDDRVAQFVADPIVQKGINQGLQIQRLESLAQNKPFNPSDYAVTGFDEAGNAQLGPVPNMRLLDAAKRGLDNIVEQYRSPVTGKLALDQYGSAVNQVRAALVSKLDALNPDYAAARASWSGPSQSMDALNAGRNILRPDSELTAQRIANLSEGDRQFFRAGAVRAVQDIMDNKTNGGPQAVAALFAKPSVQQKMAAAFPSNDSFSGFMNRTTGEMAANPLISRVLATDPTGAYTLPTSAVADEFMKPLSSKGAPEAWQTYVTAIKQAPPAVQSQAMGAARDAFAQKFLDKISSVQPDQAGDKLVLPGKLSDFLDNYAHIIKSPLFTDDQRALMSSLGDAADMSARTARAGAPGGSDTYAKLAGAKFLDAVTGKMPAKLISLGIGAAGGAVGHAVEGPIAGMVGLAEGLKEGRHVANMLYAAPREKILSLVQKAIADPQLAAALQARVLDQSQAGWAAQAYIANAFAKSGGAVSTIPQQVRDLSRSVVPAFAGNTSPTTDNSQ